MDTSIPPEIQAEINKAAKKPIHNAYENFARFLNSARRPKGVMPEVIGKKSYPINHPMAKEALEKASLKRDRKATRKIAQA